MSVPGKEETLATLDERWYTWSYRFPNPDSIGMYFPKKAWMLQTLYKIVWQKGLPRPVARYYEKLWNARWN